MGDIIEVRQTRGKALGIQEGSKCLKPSAKDPTMGHSLKSLFFQMKAFKNSVEAENDDTTSTDPSTNISKSLLNPEQNILQSLKEGNAESKSTTEGENVSETPEPAPLKKTPSWMVKKNNAFWKAIALTTLDTKTRPKDKTQETTLVNTKQALRKTKKEEETEEEEAKGDVEYIVGGDVEVEEVKEDEKTDNEEVKEETVVVEEIEKSEESVEIEEV